MVMHSQSSTHTKLSEESAAFSSRQSYISQIISNGMWCYSVYNTA
jgi:hypothetical protein